MGIMYVKNLAQCLEQRDSSTTGPSYSSKSLEITSDGMAFSKPPSQEQPLPCTDSLSISPALLWAFHLRAKWVLIFLDCGTLREGMCGSTAILLVSGTEQVLTDHWLNK